MEQFFPIDGELSYARAGTDQPPKTRVQVNNVRDRVRFIDPPLATSRLGRRILIRMALQLALLVVFLVPFCVVWHFSGLGAVAFISVVALITIWSYMRYWFLSSRYPTIIEASSKSVIVILPTRRRIEIPLTELGDIHASRPRRMIGVRGRTSSLIISAFGRKFWLLRYRDYIEVRWLARELRVAAGRSADHPAEPAVRIAADAQEMSEAEKSWSGSVPQVKDVRRSRWKNALRETISREYDKLGGAPFLCLALSVVIGMMIIANVNSILVLCISYGSDAYFKNGLRFVPHRGFLLTNGRTIAA